MGRFSNGWTLVVILLVAVTAAGGIVIWSGYSGSQAIEIFVAPDSARPVEVYIGGEVNNPGYYPLGNRDSVEDILQAAGGATADADPSRLEIFVPPMVEGELPQRVNINLAEAWLLAALPGIGEARAQAIIDYRRQNGPFRNTNDLLKVEGIGGAIYERMKHLITVAD